MPAFGNCLDLGSDLAYIAPELRGQASRLGPSSRT